MPFDLFGQGKYCYTFQNGCLEKPGLWMEDGATRIFLNTRGKNDGEISRELRDFLHYVEQTSDEFAVSTDSLELHVFAENEGAVRFYIREGFEILEEQRNPDTGKLEYRMVWSRTEGDGSHG